MDTFILKADSTRTCQISTLCSVAALAAMLAGCSTVSNGIDDLLDRTPVGDTGFSTEDEIDYQGASSFDRRFYGSINVGASQLEPETGDDSGVTVDDKVDPAGQIAAGFDLSNTFSAEVHTANLGSAGLAPIGRIDYAVSGASVLAYAGQQRNQRRGLMGYGRAGVAATSIDSDGNVAFTNDDSPQALVGAGVEYGWNNLGVRGEVIYFDKDAQLAQVGLIYRLGGSGGGTDELPEDLNPAVLPAPTAQPVPLPEPQIPTPPVSEQPLPDLQELPPLNELPPLPELPRTNEPQPLPQPELAGIPPAQQQPLDPQTFPGDQIPTDLPAALDDTDADGVPDELDSCPASTANIEVDDSGCALFNGVVDGVTFARGSAELTFDAQNVLDRAITTLRKFPNALISIAAHTDGRGKEETNLALSRDRAIAVARYMISRGIPKAQMSARAFGEYQPIADNDTPEGRAMNRRVEIVASRPN